MKLPGRNRLVAALFLSVPLTVLAQTPEGPQTPEEPTVLPEMVVTATRSEQPQNRLPAGVTVITQAEIERSGAKHIVEVLRNRSGVQITDTFGDGSRTLVGIRGFGENAHSNTLILVDGRRLSNPDIASSDLNSIALKDVERIEIIEGSAGTLYGDQAVGGVINIITRRPDKFSATVDAGIGGYSAKTLRGHASDRLPSGLSYRVSAEVRQSDNYRDHNALDYKNLLARTDYALGAGGVFLELATVDEELETPGALFENEVDTDRRQATANFQGDFSNTETDIIRLGLSQPLSERWSLESEITRRQSDGVFRLSSVFGPETQDATQDRKITGISPRLIGRYPNQHGETLITLGVDAQNADYELVSRFGTQRNDQQLRDLYVQGIVPFATGLDLTLGARRAKVENDLQDGGAFAIYPDGQKVSDRITAKQLGLSYRPDRFWRTFVRYDGNFRFAKVDEFFASGAAPGVVILDTQTGESIELGGEWTDGFWRFKSLLYRLDLKDEIAFDPVTFNNINLDTTRRDGLLLETGGWILKDLSLTFTYHYVDAQVESGSFEGNAIPLVAKQSARVALDYRVDDNCDLFAELTRTGKRAFSGDFDNTLDTLGGFTVLNLGAQYGFGAWSLRARINNVLDKEYTEFGAAGLDPVTFAERESFFPSPERNGSVTVGYEF
ncbi:MAG: TonB-dependent receptor [Nevskiales bacterium]